MLCKSSLQVYRCFCLISQTPYAASAGISYDRFFTVLIVLHLNNTVAKAAREQPHCDHIHYLASYRHKLCNFRMSTHWKKNWLLTRQYAHFEAFVLSCLCRKKPPQIWNESVQILCGQKRLCPQWKFILGHTAISPWWNWQNLTGSNWYGWQDIWELMEMK